MVERIREILSKYQLTPTQFADAIGTARPIVSHILSGRNKPSLEVVQKISAAYPDIALPWLMFGMGPMEGTASPQIQSELSTPRSKATEKPTTARVASDKPTTATHVVQASAAASVPVPVVAPSADSQPMPASNELGAQETTLPPVNHKPEAPIATALLAPESSIAPVAAPSPPPTAFQAFAEPGKAIRRIVIFYSDGTFTDYQPEAPTT
jgi:transcriptional regulator with XRE-family HTH domain